MADLTNPSIATSVPGPTSPAPEAAEIQATPVDHTLQATPPSSPVPHTPATPGPAPRDSSAPPIAPATSLATQAGAAAIDHAPDNVASPPPKKPHKGSYSAALVLLGSVIPVPIVAAILTAAVYISPLPQQSFNVIPWIAPSWIVILIGSIATLLLWLLLSLPLKSTTTFENANPISSNHLKSHLSAVKAGFTVLQQRRRLLVNGTGNNDALQSEDAYYSGFALEKVGNYLTAVDEELEREGQSWIAGTGYINTWNLVHRAEEVMIDIAPREEIIREAIYDELCLEGSAIAGRDNALLKLRIAVEKLSPSAAIYMNTPPTPTTPSTPQATQPQSSDGNTASGSSATNGTAASAIVDAKTEIEARDAIRTVKQTINEFRDSMWSGLVRIRNQLVGTALITGLLTYVLLCVVILAGALPAAIKAGMIFYLVGAMVGLFSRLYSESQSNSQAEKAVDDYGLTTARVVVMPLLSGLAAIGGVLLVAMLSLTLLRPPTPSAAASASTPTPSATAIATSTPTTAPTVPQQPAPSSQSAPTSGLADIYNLNLDAQGIVLAAIFGLAPNLLISILKQQSDTFQSQLQNSTAPEQQKS